MYEPDPQHIATALGRVTTRPPETQKLLLIDPVLLDAAFHTVGDLGRAFICAPATVEVEAGWVVVSTRRPDSGIEPTTMGTKLVNPVVGTKKNAVCTPV